MIPHHVDPAVLVRHALAELEGLGLVAALASHHDTPANPTAAIRDLLSNVLGPYTYYRLRPQAKQELPDTVQRIISSHAAEIASAALVYPPYASLHPEGTMDEDTFIDAVRVHLNDAYREKQPAIIEEVSATLWKYHSLPIHAPLVEIVLSCALMEEAIDQRALHEYLLVRADVPLSGEVELLSGFSDTNASVPSVRVFGVRPPAFDMESLFEVIIRATFELADDPHRRVFPRVMRQREYEEMLAGRMPLPDYPGYMQIHIN